MYVKKNYLDEIREKIKLYVRAYIKYMLKRFIEGGVGYCLY